MTPMGDTEGGFLQEVAELAAERMEEYFKRVGIGKYLKVWIVTFGRGHKYVRSEWRPKDKDIAEVHRLWKEKDSDYFSFQDIVDNLSVHDLSDRCRQEFNLEEALGQASTPLSKWLLSKGLLTAERAEVTRSCESSASGRAISFAKYVLRTARKAGCESEPKDLWFHFNAKSLFDDGNVHFSWQGVLESGEKEHLKTIVELIDVVVDGGAELIQARLAGALLEREEETILEANLESPFVIKPPLRFSKLDDRNDWSGCPEKLRSFARCLPKADLHCHIGTSIGLRTVESLALNTCSHSFIRGTDQSPADPTGQFPADQITSEIFWAMSLVVRLANRIFVHDTTRRSRNDRAASAVWLAAQRVQGVSPLQPMPDSAVYDTAFALFLDPSRPIEEYEVVSAFVSAIAVYSCSEPLKGFSEVWCRLLSLRNREGAEFGDSCQAAMSNLFRVFELIRWRWRSDVVKAPDRLRTEQDIGYWGETGLWKQWLDSVEIQVDRAAEMFGKMLGEAADAAVDKVKNLNRDPTLRESLALDLIGEDPPKEERIRLEDLVELPKLEQDTSGSLDRYLWGCDLLGSSHLQYPENLVLTAFDLVEQAVADRVLYTELRCAPVGYARAGMPVVEATDLLCAALDLACLVRSPSDLVRFNVLIGGKRHKPHELDQTIRLLSYFLERTDSGLFNDSGIKQQDRWFEQVGSWWKPCQVVGFDLSGREHLDVDDGSGRGQPDSEWYGRKLKPLFDHSAFITVHAGEAKSAESIWEAVYRLHARRIGHGLRLRENVLLLDYCVTEGICLELCPTSNDFTNVFEIVDSDQARNFKTTYPLRRYMIKGLQVCLGTDNRQLHADKTLTGEYVKASDMVGGLGRWDLVLLAKSGFRNAFLPVVDVEKLLQKFVSDAKKELRKADGYGFFEPKLLDLRGRGSR